ncbi:HAD family hydrolase [Streptomyces sp. NPDC059785]|uniref:HAD family hydrolase n=1 Tax=Streptomyces sp. NPDC059785 TaxID=3346945 RepID=UPI003647DC44
MATSAAFSDVDETLIRAKSMFRFLAFYLHQRGEPPSTYDRLVAGLRAAAARGVPRDRINRTYYTFYAGEEADRLATAGRAWFAEESQQRHGIFIPEIRQSLAEHRAGGEPVILVSGSFFACLDPIAAASRAEWVLGTRPLIRRGVLTGEVLVPMVGRAKGRAVRAAAAVRGLDLSGCTAYGDHISDLDMLRAVGRPVVVGGDPLLGNYAMRAAWRRISPAAVGPNTDAAPQVRSPLTG